MKVAFFSAKPYDRSSFDAVNRTFQHELIYLEAHLDETTAVLARGCGAVCAFVNDSLDRDTLCALRELGVRMILLRCAGYNHVDLQAAGELGLLVARVPEYSPFAVAEHAAALVLALNRKIHRAYHRVRESNFSLDGLMGFDLNGCTVGVFGTGKIGTAFCRIMQGFGCRILAYDLYPNKALIDSGVHYTDKDTLLIQSDILSLHCPLTPETHYLIDEEAIAKAKDGIMLINTSRGALIDARALIQGLKSGKIGYVGLDVYEEEGDLFFEDLSNQVLKDDVFARLTTFPNVIITGHQAFFTGDAMQAIAATTLNNLSHLEAGKPCSNLVSLPSGG
ncbi:MAG: 2-hydroxyacid dehydrogenase [Opitutales bacterium]|nr:2-hydroxyacid dehydrogenase [Opitutales bacterium]